MCLYIYIYTYIIYAHMYICTYLRIDRCTYINYTCTCMYVARRVLQIISPGTTISRDTFLIFRYGVANMSHDLHSNMSLLAIACHSRCMWQTCTQNHISN